MQKVICTRPTSAAVGRPAAARRRVAAAAGGAGAAPSGRFPRWEMISDYLRDVGLESLPADAAAAAVADGGAVVVDVRAAAAHADGAPAGSVSVPLFSDLDPRTGGGVGRLLKFALMSSQGVAPVEYNEGFVAAVLAAAGGGKTVVLACEAGGTTRAVGQFASGKASRSLQAAWRLVHGGALPAERVAHLEGGVLAWYRAGLPMDGEYDPSKRAFRSPNAATSAPAPGQGGGE